MELEQKLAILSDAAKYDASCASSGSKRAAIKGGIGNAEGMGICHSYTPDGRCVSLLKILLTNVCVFDCQYCINRISSDVRRARFTPEEVVTLTLDFYRRNYIEGLFLSSGIVKTSDFTMEEMIRVAKTLREVHGFGGYIHLKAVPGASARLVDEAGKYADRLSCNIELPTAGDLQKLAPEKTIASIDSVMTQVASGIEAHQAEKKVSRTAPPKFAPAGQSTQMIIGATPSSDAAILDTATRLYGVHRLRRVYYSAFSPIPLADVRLPLKSPPLVREHRLYQADWLIRFYGFKASELTTQVEPDLLLDIDPKLAWALRTHDIFPVDLNRAPKETLLRIPGLGAKNVQRLLQIRRLQKIRLQHLSALRVPMSKVSPFVVTEDHRPVKLAEPSMFRPQLKAEQTRQLSLFG